ncbi:uncharacterized protein LOC111918126 isoform X1 [Lactuca sativa]|uniref:uncharacterized protein LOC111918126 isoform X1 n=1 Tax=Lactuca sativa TaxID=4236 RepID=UPI0022AEE542|nr:uncharacterized protein LOC111918126 isoform X1 [Lactuca sativa]
MAKYGELRDDSALVKALDDAISKYKIMHGKGGTISTPDEEKITICKEESESIIFNGSNEAKSACVETEDNTTNMPNSNQVQDTESTYVDAQNAQTAEDYNVLLNQYNAVEEQRQKLLGQLYQYGNWDYQSYGYGGVYDSQDQPPQPSGPPACSCQPYVCPCSTKVSCNEDDGVIKAAMGAIDKVIQTFNTGDKEGKKSEETDLSAVLNAWFSAGFYTGKASCFKEMMMQFCER